MPIIKSAKKRVKTAAKARTRNANFKRSLRDTLKAFNRAVESGKAADIQKTQRDAVSAIDTAVKKEIIHRNRAARQKSALAARAKAAGAKVVKVEAKKAALAKKTTKTTSKKPAAKKTPAKKVTK